MKSYLCSALVLLAIVSCDNKKEAVKPSYKTPDMKLASDVMTPEVLWSFGRIGSVSVSPDQKTLVYDVTYFNKEEDRSYSDIYVMNLTDGKSKQLTDTDYKEFGETWTSDGKIAFMSSKSGSVQLWEMNADGSGLTQLTNIEGGIGGFIFSPDKSKLLFLKDVKLEQDVHDLHPDLPKANARLIDGQVYRHWNDWVEAYTHPFVADYIPGQMVTTGKDIMEGEKWESPVRPWGGTEEITWTKDGKGVIYMARKKEGIAYMTSTNTDLYLYDLNSGKTRNLTEGMMGYDQNQVISPNGELMAWESMERDGYEADKIRLFVMNLKTGEKKEYTKDFDQNVGALSWGDDNTIYFISDHHATDEIYRLTLNDGVITKLTEGVHNYTSVIPVNDYLIATKVSMSQPAEIYKVDPKTGKDTELSFVNKGILDQLTMGKVESRWIKTTDNKQMLTWIIYPPHFDPNKKYPAILYCEGGPQSTVSQFWSYRWNFRMKETGPLRLKLRQLKIYPIKLKQIMQVGIPAGIQGMLFSLANVTVQSSVNSFGEVIMAGSSAAISIEQFIYANINAFYQANVAFTSQNYGAGDYRRIKKIAWISVVTGVVTTELLSVLAVYFGPQLLGIYSPSAEVVAAGMVRLRWIALFYGLDAIMDVIVGSLRGVGYNILPMLVTLMGACASRLIWLSTVFRLPAYHRIEMVYIVYPLSWILTASTHLICYFFVSRKVDRELRAHEAELAARMEESPEEADS